MKYVSRKVEKAICGPEVDEKPSVGCGGGGGSGEKKLKTSACCQDESIPVTPATAASVPIAVPVNHADMK